MKDKEVFTDYLLDYRITQEQTENQNAYDYKDAKFPELRRERSAKRN